MDSEADKKTRALFSGGAKISTVAFRKVSKKKCEMAKLNRKNYIFACSEGHVYCDVRSGDVAE